jgi:uncharacterized membrane protein YgcG
VTPQLAAVLLSGRAVVTPLFRIGLPSGTRNLMLGSSEATWGADTFKGYDPTLGHINSGEQMREDVSGQAPNTAVSIVPAPTATMADIASATVQLAPFQIWLSALQLNVTDKHIEVVPDPELVFDGFIDQATINLTDKRKDVDYSLISGFDHFFEDSEGQRLNGQFHRSSYPGELGLDNVTGITKKIYWGMNTPVGGGGSTSIYSGGSYSGGSYGGSGRGNYKGGGFDPDVSY